MVAEVIINSIAKDLNKTFDYIIPQSIKDNVKVGSRVLVTFGARQIAEGFVINIKKESKFASKEIKKVEDTLISKEQIDLAKLMARRYFCNISDSIRLMLPPGSGLVRKSQRKNCKFCIFKKGHRRNRNFNRNRKSKKRKTS